MQNLQKVWNKNTSEPQKLVRGAELAKKIILYTYCLNIINPEVVLVLVTFIARISSLLAFLFFIKHLKGTNDQQAYIIANILGKIVTGKKWKKLKLISIKFHLIKRKNINYPKGKSMDLITECSFLLFRNAQTRIVK